MGENNVKYIYTVALERKKKVVYLYTGHFRKPQNQLSSESQHIVTEYSSPKSTAYTVNYFSVTTTKELTNTLKQ